MNIQKVAVLTIALALGACGFAVSDAERVARAESYIAENDYRAANIELRDALLGSPDNLEARLLLVDVSLALNDADSARKELLRAADLGAPNAVVQEQNVRILALEGQNLEVLAALAQDDSEIAELTTLRYRGEALIGLQNGEAAVANYTRWLELEPASPDAAVGMVKAMTVNGDPDGAFERLEAIITDHGDHAEAWQAMGMLRYQRGEYVASRDAYQHSLDIAEPQEHIRQYLTTLLGLADAELMLQNADGARQAVNRLLAVAPASPQVLFQKARVAQLEQDYYAAADALQELLLITPNEPRALMFLANVQSRLGAVEQAIVLYRRVVSLAPDNTQARKRLADLQLRQSNSRAAVEVLSPLVGSEDEDTEVSRLLAMANFQQGNAEQAVQQLEAALAAEPDNLARKIALAEAYLRNGQASLVPGLLTGNDRNTVAGGRLVMTALAEQEDDAAAAEIAEALIADHADDPEAFQASAGYYRSTGDLERAETLLRQGLSLGDVRPQTRVELAILLEQSGRRDEAMGLYREVLEADPNNMPALMALGQNASRNGDRDGAVAYLERARTAQPGNLAPRLLLASIRYNGGEFVEAETLAREMAAIGSDQPAINAVVGNILIETGALDEALAIYEIAARQAPDSLSVLIGLSRCQVALDRPEAAQRTLERALAVDAENIIAVPAMALVEYRLGDLESARQRLEAHMARNPDDQNGLIVSGDVYTALGDFDKAISAFGAAIERGAGANVVLKEYRSRVEADNDPVAPLDAWLAKYPDDPLIRAQRAEHFQTAGDRQAATREYEALLGDDQSNPVYLNNLAWEYQQSGELERALELAERARELDPDSGPIADTLGWIHFSRGDYARSENLLREASRRTPDNRDITYHLAAAMARNGKRDEAADLLRNLLQADGTFASADDARALLASL